MMDETASWAREELVGLVDVPEYGSERWHLLGPHDPLRRAGVVVAAERWREGQGVAL
ncbi:hypothetical protein [Streptomyces sp. 049-1]|uniref:hypothetical protein n=1 Tax=Streptomyces sp. 049-1 TaxID=2789264 RepID=UPI00397F954A